MGLRRLKRLGLCARGMAGGDVAVKVLRLPSAGKRFRKFDWRYYCPLFGLIGLAIGSSAKI